MKMAKLMAGIGLIALAAPPALAHPGHGPDGFAHVVEHLVVLGLLAAAIGLGLRAAKLVSDRLGRR